MKASRFAITEFFSHKKEHHRTLARFFVAFGMLFYLFSSLILLVFVYAPKGLKRAIHLHVWEDSLCSGTVFLLSPEHLARRCGMLLCVIKAALTRQHSSTWIFFACCFSCAELFCYIIEDAQMYFRIRNAFSQFNLCKAA